MSSVDVSPSEMIGPNELLFRVHPRKDDSDLVSASVFASKLSSLVRALQAADRAVNAGAIAHDYKIAKLKSSSPTVLLTEVRLQKFENDFEIKPAIPAIETCLDAVIAGEADRALQFRNCAAIVSRLASGSVKTFGYAEVWTGPKHVFRVDSFLHDQATAIIRPTPLPEVANDQWFKGAVFGSFDGEVRFVDTRGEIPEFKLLLSAGGAEINCICHSDQFEQVRPAINKRARIYGRAIYDGTSGLPRRVEIASIELVKGGTDFSKWKGAFRPFEPSQWPDDDA